METLQNGYTLEIAPGAFPLSTDSMLLSGFIKLKKDSKVLDLGSGCGTLGLLLCAINSHCTVTGIELDETAHRAALDNINRNDLTSRLFSVCADLRQIPTLFQAGSFSCCISNPPYFSGGPASKTAPLARRNDCCCTEDLFRAAAWSLGTGGDFYLVHKPDQLALLCACAVNADLQPKRLQLVRYAPDKPVSLILLHCRKGAKPGLVWEEICLHNADGSPSDYYKKLYHIEEADHGRNALSGADTHR